MAEQIGTPHQQLYLKDRKTLTLNEVLSVKDFTDTQLIVDTSLGTAYIEGEELRIESLSKETSSIQVVGNISGIYFKTEKPRRKFLFGKS